MRPECVIQHRAHRRNPGPTGDKEQSRLFDACWKRKRANRSIDIHEGACGRPLQIFRSALHRDQQFEGTRFGGAFG